MVAWTDVEPLREDHFSADALCVSGSHRLQWMPLRDVPIPPGYVTRAGYMNGGLVVGETMANTLAVLAPVAEAYVVPELLTTWGSAERMARSARATHLPCGTAMRPLGGMCWRREDGPPVILVSGGSPANQTMAIAYHEAFHAVWPHLSQTEIATLRREMANGADWSDPEYLNTIEERCARSFETFASLVTEGCRLPFVTGTASEVLNLIWSGDVGRRALPPPPTLSSRLASHLRQRMARPARAA